MFGLGKKKKTEKDDVLTGGKKKPEAKIASRNPIKKSVKSTQEKAVAVKKEESPVNTQSASKNKKTKDIFKENFANPDQVPLGRVVSQDAESEFYVPEEFQEHIFILEALHAPQGLGDKVACIIFICTKNYRGKVNIQKYSQAAKSKTMPFVFCQKENAASFIETLKKTNRKNNSEEDKNYSKKQKQATDLFQDAVDAGASDLHIEVRQTKTLIRARINGTLSPFAEAKSLGTYMLAEEDGWELCRSIFNSLSGVGGKPFNPKKTQDTLVVVKSPRDNTTIRVRVATAPSEPEGFDMVMRLLVVKDTSKPLTLNQLGYQKKQREMIEEGIAQGVGVTIVAGTTGSGKSTTLQNILKAEIQSKNNNIKVITVEDPPEYFIPGATQIPVVRDDGDAKAAFKNALKASMRMDPDVIMIGEVRDEQSAELLIEAVQTGHKVMSTIHAGSALAIIPRLENLGVDREVLGDTEFISALIYQKLFPVICPHCSISLKDGIIPSKKPIEKILIENSLTNMEAIQTAKKKYPNVPLIRALQDMGLLDLKRAERAIEIFAKENNEEDNEKFLKRIASIAGNIHEHDIRFKGEGCEHCKDGISGRTVVSEVVRPDMRLRELITEGKNTEVFKYWKKNLGGKLAREDAYDKMLQGKLSPIDIEDTFGYITVKTGI